jgi:hypothetical protein
MGNCMHYIYSRLEYRVDIYYGPWIEGFYYLNPSECRMFIPGSYAQMLEDYE